MNFRKFEIYAEPEIINARCKCGEILRVLGSGLVDYYLYCIKCESVYTLKLYKLSDKEIDKRILNNYIKSYNKRLTNKRILDCRIKRVK